MPYTRAELLTAVRHDHPELAHIDDIRLFKAIAIDHPQLAQGVVETPFQSPKWEAGSDPLTEGLKTASEGAEHVLEGVPKAITGIPDALMAAPGLALAMAKLHFGMASPEDIQTVIGAVKGVAAPVTPIAKTAIGQPPPPDSPEWTTAQEGAGAVLGGAALDASGVIPKVGNVTKAIAKPVAGVIGDVLGTVGEAGRSIKTAATTGAFPTRPSLSTLTEALSPGDLQFQKAATGGLSEMKAGSRQVRTIEDGLANLEERFKVNNAAVKKIVTPQSEVDASAYRQHIVQKQIDAIPMDAKPAIRTRLIRDIESRTPKKITIGWLNDMRSELAATQSPFYGKDATGQITMDAGQRAVDIARGGAVRESFYHALDNAPGAMGGGAEARTLNGRIGDSLHLKDAAQHKLNAAVAERQSPMAQRLQKVRHAIGRPGQTIAHGFPETIDEMISNAVKDHPDLPIEVKPEFKMRKGGDPLGTPKETGPVQQELAPSNGGPLLNPQERSPITPGHSDMEDVFRRERAQSELLPEGVAPPAPDPELGQMDLPVTPPPEPLFREPGVGMPTKKGPAIQLPKAEPKMDSNYEIIDETKPPATAGSPTEDILEIVKRLLAGQK